MKGKKRSKRDRSKYPGLDKSVNLKIRHEVMDFDYLDKLSESEKVWLSNFMREYASADFSHPGKLINKGKKRRKSAYDANNARNRDSFAVTKSNGMLKGFSGKDLGKEAHGAPVKELGMSGSRSTVPNEVEDTMLTVLDHFNSLRPKK